MFDEGYTTFCGIDCVFISNKDEIKLIPINKDDIRKLNAHFDDQNFYFRFSEAVDKNCIAYIDRVKMNAGHSLSLVPKYVLKLLNKGLISSMEITGPAIDEIFHPASYFYEKAVFDEKNEIDLTKEREIADTWTLTVDGSLIQICLQYGEILRHGLASDMMLHPVLFVTFQPTQDSAYIYKLYSIITRFFQILQYNVNFGECKVYLHGCAPDHNSGYLFDWDRVGLKRSFYNQVEYRYIKPYIGKLLQFSADNIDVSLDFLPNATYRWSRTDYSTQIFASLFAAFESEYKANINAFEEKSQEDVQRVKEKVIQKIHEIKSDALSQTEKNFIMQAENSVQHIGNQTGQAQKIKNSIQAMSAALKKSAEHLFVRGKIGTKDGFTQKEINHIANKIVGLRSQIAHEYTLTMFDDLQAEYVHFLEILLHALMLKRAGIDDAGIELILGLVFHCNTVYFEKFKEESKYGSS